MFTKGILWEVVVDGSSQTYRLLKESALDAARSWKERTPQADVGVRRHGSENLTVVDTKISDGTLRELVPLRRNFFN
jgi:hypothetical protein